MKNKYILLILLLISMLIIPSVVKANNTCNYVGRMSTRIEYIEENDTKNTTAVSVVVDSTNETIMINGLPNVTNNYNLFKNNCPERIYLCSLGSQGNYRIYSSDDRKSCDSYVNLVLKSSSGYNKANNRGGYGTNESVNCDYLLGDPDDSKYIAYWLQWALDLMKYLGIIALFVMSTVDFVKALVQNDQDALKKAATTSLKRFVLCVLLFFVPIIVDTLMSFLGAYGTCSIG